MARRSNTNKRLELTIVKISGDVLSHWTGGRRCTGRDVKEHIHRVGNACPCSQQLMFGQYMIGDSDALGDVIPDTRSASVTLVYRVPPSALEDCRPWSELEQLKSVDGFCATCLKGAGYSITQLWAAGWCSDSELHELRLAGFTVIDLLGEIGYIPGMTHLSIRRLRFAGFSAAEVKEAVGVSAEVLRSAGFHTSELKEAGFSVDELYESRIASYDMPLACSVQEMRSAGYNAKQLRDAGFGLYALTTHGGFDKATELLNAGFTAAELVGARFSCSELAKAGLTARQLRDAGFDARRLREVGFSASELKKCGLNASRLRRAGFDACQLKEGGFGARQLKAASFNVRDLEAAGFTTVQLKAAGFDISKAQGVDLHTHKTKQPTVTEQLACNGSQRQKTTRADYQSQVQRRATATMQLARDTCQLRQDRFNLSIVALTVSCLLWVCIVLHGFFRDNYLM